MPVRVSAPVVAALVLLGAGCADRPTGGPLTSATTPPDTSPPVIDPGQLAYDPNARTLHLYDLIADPQSGRKGMWEVRLADETVAYPTGKTFQLPPDVAEEDVTIRAAAPPGPPSAAVRLSAVPRKK